MGLVRVKSLLSSWQHPSSLLCSAGPENRGDPPDSSHWARGPPDQSNMLAAMLRQSTGSGGSSNSSGGGTKLPRLSSSSMGPWLTDRDSKSCSVSTDSSDIPASDPSYIMQLVSDVRMFADVLLQLKEVFNSKGNSLQEIFFNMLLSFPTALCIFKSTFSSNQAIE